MGQKAGKLEMREREEKILDLIGKGFSRAEISKVLAPEYRVSRQSIEKQYDKTIKSWAKDNSSLKEETKAVYLQQLSDLYKRAYEAGHWKAAGELVEKQAKLHGMYQPKAVEAEKPATIKIMEKGSLEVVPGGKSGTDEE